MLIMMMMMPATTTIVRAKPRCGFLSPACS